VIDEGDVDGLLLSRQAKRFQRLANHPAEVDELTVETNLATDDPEDVEQAVDDAPEEKARASAPGESCSRLIVSGSDLQCTGVRRQ
jgi:hypothetical protein